MQRPCAQDLYKIKSKKTKALFYISAKKSSLIIQGILFVQKKKNSGIKMAKETILSTHRKTIAPFS